MFHFLVIKLIAILLDNTYDFAYYDFIHNVIAQQTGKKHRQTFQTELKHLQVCGK